LKQSAKALFLHKISYSESSLITVFYTREFGLQHFLFQGGKKKAAALYPCALCELTFYKRPDSMLALNFLIEFAVHLGIEPLTEGTNKRYFYLNEGSFSNVDLTGDLVREGSAVFLIQDILRGGSIEQYLLQDKRIALEIMIRYYELHIPNFNVDRSLTVIREVLYT